MDDRITRIKQLGFNYSKKKKELIKQCNLCGSKYTIVFSHFDRYGFKVFSRLCLNCGLAFLSPRMIAKEYADFYKRMYRPLVSAYHGRIINEDTIQLEQAHYAEYIWELLREQLMPKGRYSLLDVGGSTGEVAYQICKLAQDEMDISVSATILDPAPLEIEQARRKNLETITDLIEDFDPGKRKWDIVLICQTIDHVLDVFATLSKVRKLMNDEALLFIDVVDWEYALLNKNCVEETIKIDHPYMLTRNTITHYFSQIGLLPKLESISPSGHLIGFLCKKNKYAITFHQRHMRHYANQLLCLIRKIQAQCQT